MRLSSFSHLSTRKCASSDVGHVQVQVSIIIFVSRRLTLFFRTGHSGGCPTENKLTWILNDTEPMKLAFDQAKQYCDHVYKGRTQPPSGHSTMRVEKKSDVLRAYTFLKKRKARENDLLKDDVDVVKVAKHM